MHAATGATDPLSLTTGATLLVIPLQEPQRLFLSGCSVHCEAYSATRIPMINNLLHVQLHNSLRRFKHLALEALPSATISFPNRVVGIRK